MKIYYN